MCHQRPWLKQLKPNSSVPTSVIYPMVVRELALSLLQVNQQLFDLLRGRLKKEYPL